MARTFGRRPRRLSDDEMRLIRKRDRERTESLATADRHVLLEHIDAVDREASQATPPLS